VVERAALADVDAWLRPLEHVGLSQARRPLVARADGLESSLEGDVLTLGFALGPGRYASVLIAELGEFAVAPGDAV
jgi:tRNA(Glu) U13 pseudouridine synthase TruD